jgi:hypothetical protein
MTRSYVTAATLLSALATAGVAYAQQPPNVVQSDAGGNTAMGADALLHLSPAETQDGIGQNTAAGYDALFSNTDGRYNTGTGYAVLFYNTTGSYNTGTGDNAISRNTMGNFNTAMGFEALSLNVAGNNNTAIGGWALLSNSGNDNAAFGFSAMYYNATGANNTALGPNALGTNRGGSNNIAVGANSGYYVRGGNYNIEIGNVGTATDAGTIRIGTSNRQSATYVAGITNAHVAGSAVYISATGQLGVLASSERYKTNVASMGPSSEKVRELRPVTFRLKSDPKAGVQYGLIAEEVAKVYPELVIRGDKGQIEGVRYEELTPMLLNEVQRQQQELADLKLQVAELQELQRKAHH